MSAITLSHSPADGTLADGTRRGDHAGTVLRAHGLRFSRTLELWYLPRSRDKHANTALLDRIGRCARRWLDASRVLTRTVMRRYSAFRHRYRPRVVPVSQAGASNVRRCALRCQGLRAGPPATWR